MVDTSEDASNPEKVASKIEFLVSHVYIGDITNKMRMNMEIEKSVDVLFNEVAQCNALTAEEDFTLTKAVQDKGTDCNEMKKLHEVYDRFVESIAKQYLDKGLSLDELVEVGKTGLEKAAMKYDSTRGFKFIAYAVWWIRQPMLVAIESKK